MRSEESTEYSMISQVNHLELLSLNDNCIICVIVTTVKD